MEVGGFEMDGGVEMTLIQAYIDVQKCDFFRRGVPGELDGIAAVEAFKGEEVGTMRPKEENVINNAQPEAGFLRKWSEGNSVQGKSYEEVCKARGYVCAHMKWHINLF